MTDSISTNTRTDMKATDLMIGDWVYWSHTEDGIMPYKEAIRINSDDFSRDGCIFDAHIEPIPITPEILENNGFEVIGKRKYYLVPNDPSLAIKREPIIGAHGNTFLIGHFIDEKTFQWFIELTYIHELQHALRLCGIDKEIEL